MTITRAACQVGGTTSRLAVGNQISLLDSLYGMMLPSGNDAAYLLAENIGLLITCGRSDLNHRSDHQLYSDIESLDVTSYDCTEKFVAAFVKQMNRRAKQLGMENTEFSNAHGMQSM
jgi:D-alanyl-D-alanine carboxypeptidase (penicillin-binding protein 5/6)